MKPPLPLQKYILDLIDIYVIAQKSIINTIASKNAIGSQAKFEQSLLKQINKEISTLNNKSYSWLAKYIPRAFMEGVANVNNAITKMGIQIPSNFTTLHTPAIQVMVANKQEELITANNYVGRVVRDNIRQAGLEVSAQNIAIGASAKQAKDALVNRLITDGVMGIKTKSGRMIALDKYGSLVARSTIREATNTATINQIVMLGYDLVKMSSHATTCPVCAPLQGRVYSISGQNPQYPKLSIAYKGIYANIHPNCFVAGTMVTSPELLSTSSRDYCGEVVTFITASGNEVTVTPNHPILTSEGWVNAGLLKEGQKVIENRFTDKPATLDINPNNIDIPTKIEDVVHSFRKSSGVTSRSVKITSKDFDGDGVNSKVGVIDMNSFLGDKTNIMSKKHIGKSIFMNSGYSARFFNANSFFNKSFGWLFSTFESVIGRCGKFFTFFGGHSLQSCTHGFTPSSSFRKSIFGKTKSDNSFVNTKALSDRIFGFTKFISINNFINRQNNFIVTRFIVNAWSKFRKFNIRFSQPFFKDSLADVDDGRYLIKCLAGQIKASNIIEVNKNFFTGQVYNLQTQDNWYIANNIITHNCKHVLMPYIPSLADNLESDLAFSNKPFDIDPRSKEQITAYNTVQEKKRQLNNDKKQWERYKLLMPEETPSSLSGFIRSKQSNSDNWQKLESQYRSKRLTKGDETNAI